MSQYLTVQEFKNAPTGIDCASIIPGGTREQNDAELGNIIRRASGWIDKICKVGTLEATKNVEIREVTLNNSGLIRVHPDNIPIIELLDPIQYRVSPSSDWISLPLDYIEVFGRYFVIYNFNTPTVTPAFSLLYPNWGYTSPYRIKNLQKIPITLKYTYVNGYPNTFVSDYAPAGQNTFSVKEPLGIKPDQQLTFYDNEYTETITVQSVNGSVVTATAPLQYDHDVDAALSALPAVVKQACILLTSYLIKERGALAIMMNEQSLQGISRYKDASDVETAKELLAPLIRGVVS